MPEMDEPVCVQVGIIEWQRVMQSTEYENTSDDCTNCVEKVHTIKYRKRLINWNKICAIFIFCLFEM